MSKTVPLEMPKIGDIYRTLDGDAQVVKLPNAATMDLADVKDPIWRAWAWQCFDTWRSMGPVLMVSRAGKVIWEAT